MGVVLLHGRVGAQEEVPGRSNQRCVFSNRRGRRRGKRYRAAALWDEDWHRAKRSSLTALLNAYLEAMATVGVVERREERVRAVMELALCRCNGVVVGEQGLARAGFRDSTLPRRASTPPGLSKLRAFSSYPRPPFSLPLHSLTIPARPRSPLLRQTAAMSAFRPTTRILNFSRNLLRSPAFRQAPQRRLQSTAADANAAPQSAFAKLWNSPVGPKTVHFWYVIISDFARRAPALAKKNVASRAIMLNGVDFTQTT